jgi:hypothetical protein
MSDPYLFLAGPLGEKERPAVCESRRKSEKTLLAALLDLVAANPRSSAALRKILTEFKLRPKQAMPRSCDTCQTSTYAQSCEMYGFRKILTKFTPT